LEITPEKKKGGIFGFLVFLLFRPSGETSGTVIGYRTARMGYLRLQMPIAHIFFFISGTIAPHTPICCVEKSKRIICIIPVNKSGNTP